jgi:hypothetical protein
MSLRAGYKGMHVVTEQELGDMIRDMIREDILKVYVGDAVLTPAEQEEVRPEACSSARVLVELGRAI